jgi:hypothetical protein
VRPRTYDESNRTFTVAGIRALLANHPCLHGTSAQIRQVMETEGADMSMSPGDFLRSKFPDCIVGFSAARDEYSLRPKMLGQQ